MWDSKKKPKTDCAMCLDLSDWGEEISVQKYQNMILSSISVITETLWIWIQTIYLVLGNNRGHQVAKDELKEIEVSDGSFDVMGFIDWLCMVLIIKPCLKDATKESIVVFHRVYHSPHSFFFHFSLFSPVKWNRIMAKCNLYLRQLRA